MKKTVRKLISCFLVLSMCSGILTVPAAAAEDAGTTTTVEITVDIVGDSGNVIGQQTTTSTTSNTSSDTTSTSTTTVKEDWKTSETTTNPEISTTVDKPTGGADDVSVTNPSAGTITTKTETSVTVTTDGTQTSVDNVTVASADGIIIYSGSASGSETTTTVDTTTTTTTVTNELHEDVTDPTAPQDTPVEDWPTEWDPEFTEQGLAEGGEGKWTPDPSQSETLPDDQYIKVEGSEDTPIETQPVEAEAVDGVDPNKLADLNPLDDQNDVDSDRDSTDTNTDVDKAELSMSLAGLTYKALDGTALPYEDGQVLDDGRVVTVKYDDQNNPVGYFLSSNAADKLYFSLEDILKDGFFEDDSIRPVEVEGELVGYIVTNKTPRGDGTAPTGPDAETVTTETDADSYGEITVSHVYPTGYTPPQAGPIVNEETGEEGTRTVAEIVEKDAEGNDVVVGYEITETYVSYVTITDGTSVTTSLDPGINITYTMPEEPKAPDPVTVDGLTTTVTVEKIYENGEHVGYTTITTVTDESGKQVSQYQESIYRTEHSTTRDAEGTPNTETKTPTSQVVTRTVVTKIVGTQEYQEFTKTSSGTAPNVKYQDVTEDLYQLVETDDGMYFLYKGTLYAVIDSSAAPVPEILDTGNLTGSYAGEEADTNDLRLKGDMEIKGERAHEIDTFYTNQNTNASNIPTGESLWNLIGNGMVSDFTVQELHDNNGDGRLDGHGAQMFKIAQKDAKGNTIYRYVYCAELGESITPGGSHYGENQYKTAEGCNWAEASNSIEKLRSVALNGYWGTDNGIGSIEAVRDLMKRNLSLINQNRSADQQLTYDDIDALTPGMAIAATQVAIWNYANDYGSKSFGDDFLYLDDGLMADYINWAGKEEGTQVSSGQFILSDILVGTSSLEQEFLNSAAKEIHTDSGEVKTVTVLEEVESTVKTITALRDLLITLADDSSGKGVAQEITADSIKEAGFIIHDKAANPSDTAVADAAGKQEYNTDVTFKLDVSTSSINGDLVVKVLVGDEVVGGGRLAGNENSGLFPDFLFDKIYPDENGVYTIKNVELAEGVKVDLKLEGTQHLDDGVYIFENEEADYQDFIGLSKLEKDVDVAVTMSFDVVEADPQFRHTQTKWVESKTDTDGFTKTDTYYQTKDGVATNQYETVNTKTYGTTVTVSTLVSTTKENREWVSAYYHQVSIGNDGETENGTKAHVAKTGDITLAVAMVSLFSAGGLVALNWKKKED